MFLLPHRRLITATFFGFLLVTFFIYGQVLQHQFIALDDPFVIVNNLSIRSINAETLKHIFTSYDPELYTPLTFLTYQLSYLAGGLNPAWYHIVNILLHALNATLVTVFMMLFFEKKSLGIFTGLLFAVHPLNTEVVSWATARKESLSAFFMLLSMIGYVLYNRGKKNMYVGSIVTFFLALLSKVNVATLPALLFLIDFQEKRPLTKKSILEKIPYIILSIAFVIIGLLPKLGIFGSTTVMEKILMTAKSTVFYLTKFIFPLQLSVLYPNKNPIQLAFPDFQIALVSLILIFAFVFWSLRKTRSIFFGFMFFFLAISPTFLHFNRKGSLTDGAVSGIQFASDHYMYVPMIGLVFLVTLLVQTLWSRETMMRKRSKGKDLLFGSLLVILLTFSGLSFTQAAVWKDSKTLFEHTLSIYPYSTASRVGLSVVFRKSGNIEKEKQVLQDGLEFGDSAILHAGLGALEVRTGNFFAAEREYEAALLADPSNAEVHFGLGTLLSAQGKNDQAMNAYLKALSLDPLYPAAENNIGSLLIEKGDEVAAKEHFLKAVEINPAFREGYVNLARVSMTAQQFEESIEWYTKAIELDPNDLLTHIELAQVYLQTGKNTAAFEEIKAVLQKDPNNAPAKALVKEMVRLGILGNG